jgi:hypothetical protein
MSSPTLAGHRFPLSSASEQDRAVMLESPIYFRAESHLDIAPSVVPNQHKQRKRIIHSRNHRHLFFDSSCVHSYTDVIPQSCTIILHCWGYVIATHSCYENPIHPSQLSNSSPKKHYAIHASAPLHYMALTEDVVPFSPIPHYSSH